MHAARRPRAPWRHLRIAILVLLSARAFCQPPAAPVPVIVDDDGSADGMLGLICLLQDPRFEVQAVTISNGIAHPDVFAPLAQRMLARLGRTDIPVAAGGLTPLEGDNAFPEAWRGDTDRFWDLALPEATGPRATIGAAELIAQVLRQSPQPVAILATGPLTNVAEALRTDADMAARIRIVEVMGGAVWVPGNVGVESGSVANDVAEWNIWIDPVAADEVLASGVEVRFVPLDVTNRVLFTAGDAAAWRASGTPAGELSAELLEYLLKQTGKTRVSLWDAVAAIDLGDPQCCSAPRVHVDIITDEGPEEGWTKPCAGENPNCVACREPRGRRIRQRMTALLTGP